jgi:hypothetical protein
VVVVMVATTGTEVVVEVRFTEVGLTLHCTPTGVWTGIRESVPEMQVIGTFPVKPGIAVTVRL